MLRKVDVFLLKSSTKKAISGGIDAYNSGLNRINTFKYFYDQSSDVEANKLKVLTALFEHFMLLDTANGNSEVPNHAKVLIIDTKFSNVASQNLYDMSHSEFESILRNSKILLDYFASFWFSSIPAKYTSYERKNLAAYHIGDYVFTALRYNQTNIREAWTLARVIAKKAGELIIETDFLGTRGRITVTNNELIKPAFIY
jgi:hypothetical protein